MIPLPLEISLLWTRQRHRPFYSILVQSLAFSCRSAVFNSHKCPLKGCFRGGSDVGNIWLISRCKGRKTRETKVMMMMKISSLQSNLKPVSTLCMKEISVISTVSLRFVGHQLFIINALNASSASPHTLLSMLFCSTSSSISRFQSSLFLYYVLEDQSPLALLCLCGAQIRGPSRTAFSTCKHNQHPESF